MNYRELGNTGLMVSEIGLGCEGLALEDGGMAKPMLDAAEQYGINYIDMYIADPNAKAAVGKALRGRRDKFIIQGHLCSVWKDNQYMRSRDLDEVKAGFKLTLDLLETDYIEVGMIHYVDAESDWQTVIDNGILDYARELKAKGVIGHIGMSSHNPLIALKAIEEGDIEVLMFSINPCYDLQPASEDVNDLWADETYSNSYENMDPDRQRLYEECQRRGVGITVMKCFGGGDLMSDELSPAGVALTPVQCISYALSRPAVATICSGARSLDDLAKSAAYEDATVEERDYAAAFATFPRVSWSGHCMYCSHCAPCPVEISVADVTKFLNLAIAQGEVPETVREHYKVLDHHAGECLQCGLCETRCPFGVEIRANMTKAADVFGY